MMEEGTQWQGRTSGTPWMHRTLIAMFKVLPLWLMYFFMSFTIPFYMVINHRQWMAIYHYFRKRQNCGQLRAFFSTCANHYVFGAVVMDKFASYAGRRFKVEVLNGDIFKDMSKSEKGFIMLSAHVGNDEIAGYTLKAPKRMNVIVFGGEAATISQSRSKMLDTNNILLIPAGEDMDYLYTLGQAVHDGEILNFHADRIFGSKKTVPAKLLGGSVNLPCGPFAMARMADIPAISVFVIKKSMHKYKIFIDKVMNGPKDAGRDEYVAAMAQSYCDNLGKVLREHSLQWFNFYEFWTD